MLMQGARFSLTSASTPAKWGTGVAALVSAFAVLALVLFESGVEVFSAMDHQELSATEVLVRQLEQSGKSSNARKFTLLTSLGNVLAGEGHHAEAAERYEAAMRVAPNSALHADAGRLLGVAHARQGRLVEASNRLEYALAGAAHGTQSHLDALSALAALRLDSGRIEEGLRLYETAYNLALSRGDLDKAALLAADLSDGTARRGEGAESALWVNTAAEVLSESSGRGAGADALVAAKVAMARGAGYHSKGDLARASMHYRTAQRLQLGALRPGHPDLVATRLNVARALRDQGDADGALREVEAVEGQLRKGPQPGPELSRALIFKSDLLRAAGRVEEAEATVKEAIGLQQACFKGQDHPEVAVALSSLGSIMQDTGRAREAQALYEQALGIQMRTVGERHPETAAVHNSLGTAFEDVGDDNLAHRHFSKCLEIQLDTIGRSNPGVANTYNNMASVLFRQGHSADAAKLLERAISILSEAGVPEQSPDHVLYSDNLQAIRESM